MDSDCVNNAGCNITSAGSGICIQYRTIEPHFAVGNCDNHQSLLCSSGTCFEKNGADICSIPLTAIEPLPQRCSSLQVSCQSKADEFFINTNFMESTCNCAKNLGGNMYCELFLGDPPAIQYTEQAILWLNSDLSKYCNTIRRNNPICIADFWDSTNSHKFNYYLSYYNNYPVITGAENCVLGIFYSAYYQAYNAYENDHSSAQFLVISALLLNLI